MVMIHDSLYRIHFPDCGIHQSKVERLVHGHWGLVEGIIIHKRHMAMIMAMYRYVGL